MFSVPASWTAAAIAKLPGSCTAQQLLIAMIASAVAPLAVRYMWKLLGSHDGTAIQGGYRSATRTSDRLSVAERRRMWRHEAMAAMAALAPDLAAVAAGWMISAAAC